MTWAAGDLLPRSKVWLELHPELQSEGEREQEHVQKVGKPPDQPRQTQDAARYASGDGNDRSPIGDRHSVLLEALGTEELLLYRPVPLLARHKPAHSLSFSPPACA